MNKILSYNPINCAGNRTDFFLSSISRIRVVKLYKTMFEVNFTSTNNP